MHIRDHFAHAAGPTLSFEFFPTKTDEARTKLHATINELASARPAFISLTYGAGARPATPLRRS
jgi:methylenetetrahydrofolate reductase (NADPH)